MGTILIRSSLVFLFWGNFFLEAVRSSQLLKTKHLRLIHDVRRRNADVVQLLLAGALLRHYGNVILRGSADCISAAHAISHVFNLGKCVVQTACRQILEELLKIEEPLCANVEKPKLREIMSHFSRKIPAL